MAINWKNTAENLVLILLSVIIGAFIGFTISINTAQIIVDSQEETIREAIRKETTAINNTVNNDFDKIKSRKSEPINIVIKPESTSAIQQNKFVAATDTLPKQEIKTEKRSWIGRLFSRKHKKESKN